MTTYLVDASVIIEYLLMHTYTAHARAFLKTGDSTFVVPEFCLVECTNVLWKYVRFHNMPPDEANALLRELRQLPLERTAVKRELPKALRIGITHQLAVYDSMYIALAARSGYPLVSIDEKQLRTAIAEGIRVKPLTDFV